MRSLLRRSMGVALAAVLTGSALSACAPQTTPATSTSAVSDADIAKAMKTPTTITFWSWVTDIGDEVKLFEKQYPAITVKVVNLGSGADYYTKLRSAIEAGKGAPDAAEIELHHLGSFELKKSLVDLAPYGAASLKSGFEPFAWNQVASGSSVYAIPQDTGPMGLLYRKDLLEEHGITAPTTWAEFAVAAKTLHAADPSLYLTNLSGSNWTPLVGLLQQAGAKPFSYDGDKTVRIDLESAQSKKVIDYWDDLIQSGAVSTDPDFTDSWYQGLAKGKYASWVTAAWGPLFLAGTAKDTSGKWRASELPQWTAGEHASGVIGGAANAVIAGTDHKIAAAKFVQFLTSDPTSSMQLSKQQFLFPALSATLKDPSFTDDPVEFFGGQKVNELFSTVSSDIDQSSVSWLPFMDYVGQSYNDTLGTAIGKKTALEPALAQWQSQLVAYAKSQGFTVVTG